MRTGILFLIFSVIVLSVHSQSDSMFMKHLVDEKLRFEHQAYIVELNIPEEERDFEWAKYHLHYEEDSLFFTYLNRIEDRVLKDDAFCFYASSHFMKSREPYRSRWFDFISVHQSKSTEIAQIYQIVQTKEKADVLSIPTGLQSSYNQYFKASHKKPFLAASFSAIVPGAGQLYIGRPRAFLTSFMLLGVLGLQSYESYHKLGWQHPLTIINLGFFTGYYVVNIFGSQRDTKLKAQELKEQYLIDASKYYQYNFHPTLY